jgi:hypothetical protein
VGDPARSENRPGAQAKQGEDGDAAYVPGKKEYEEIQGSGEEEVVAVSGKRVFGAQLLGHLSSSPPVQPYREDTPGTALAPWCWRWTPMDKGGKCWLQQRKPFRRGTQYTLMSQRCCFPPQTSSPQGTGGKADQGTR